MHCHALGLEMTILDHPIDRTLQVKHEGVSTGEFGGNTVDPAMADKACRVLVDDSCRSPASENQLRSTARVHRAVAEPKAVKLLLIRERDLPIDYVVAGRAEEDPPFSINRILDRREVVVLPVALRAPVLHKRHIHELVAEYAGRG